MRRIIIVLAAVLVLAGCSKGELYLGGKGYVSVDGEKKLSLNYAYQADMNNIGLGDAVWYMFEEKQETGAIDYEASRIYLHAAKDAKGRDYPFTVFVREVPGCGDGIWLDGIELGEDGYFFKELAHPLKEGEEPEYNTYKVKVDKFSYTKGITTRLNVDITITCDAFDYAVRVVYSGATPNDGMTYVVKD